MEFRQEQSGNSSLEGQERSLVVEDMMRYQEIGDLHERIRAIAKEQGPINSQRIAVYAGLSPEETEEYIQFWLDKGFVRRHSASEGSKWDLYYSMDIWGYEADYKESMKEVGDLHGQAKIAVKVFLGRVLGK
ncbi:hypothetical protein KJ632_03560 [Patescibacteria group bacterium]|nr:hypothetical protein [Patescibacteria group bacterium]